MEVIPASNDGSISYFNPKTNRFHDPVTKRMVKTPAIYQPGNKLKQEDAKMSPLDSMMEVFFEMRDNLKQLVGLTKLAVGIEKKEEARNVTAARDLRLEGGDTDIPDTPPASEKEGGFLSGIKGAFGNLMKPNLGSKAKLLLLAAGLWGLTKFSETIVKTLAPMLEWLDKTITTFREQGFEAGMEGLKDDFIDYIVNPSLGVLGLEYDKENGDIDRKAGSWLDVLDPISGETTLFTSIIDAYNALLTGRYPGKKKKGGGYEQGERIFKGSWADFLYDDEGIGFAKDPVLEDTKEAGFWKSLINLTWGRKPDGTPIIDFKNLTKDLTKNADSFIKSFKKDMNGLMSTDWFEKLDDWMKNDFWLNNLELPELPDTKDWPKWMSDPTVLGENIKTFLKGLVPAWMTDDKKDLDLKLKELDKKLGLPTEDEIEKALKDMMKLIYDPDTGAVFGINFSNLKNFLPSLKNIVLGIVSGLPKWMRPDTLLEKVEDARMAVENQTRDIAQAKLDKSQGENIPNKEILGMEKMLLKYKADYEKKKAELEATYPGASDLFAESTLPPQDLNIGASTPTMTTKTKNLIKEYSQNRGLQLNPMVPPPIVIKSEGDVIASGNSTTDITIPKEVNHNDWLPNQAAWVNNPAFQ